MASKTHTHQEEGRLPRELTWAAGWRSVTQLTLHLLAEAAHSSLRAPVPHLSPEKWAWMRREAPYSWMRLLWISMIAPVVGTYCGVRVEGVVPSGQDRAAVNLRPAHFQPPGHCPP